MFAKPHVVSYMKTLIVTLLLSACLSAHAQQVVKENDKLVYNGHEFRVGQIVQLGYGSRQDKGFAYVFGNSYGKPMERMTMPSMYNNYRCTITKLVSFRGKYFVQARPIGRTFKVQIDVVGAIDNKELVL